MELKYVNVLGILPRTDGRTLKRKFLNGRYNINIPQFLKWRGIANTILHLGSNSGPCTFKDSVLITDVSVKVVSTDM